MQYFRVYEQRGDDLKLIDGNFQAHDSSHAVLRWMDLFGDNYGKVVILPSFSTRNHVAFN